MGADGGADAGRSAAQPEERKTETTLTTRVRINIPGSRPIPPVVVRKSVADGEPADDTAAEPATPGAPGAAASPAEPPSPSGQPGRAAQPGQPAEEKTSDWFAPRKSAPAKGGPGAEAPTGPNAPAGGARPAGGRPGGTAGAAGAVGAMSGPGAPRPGGANATNGQGLPGGATGGPVAPGHGGGTGSFDVTDALAAAEARRDETPYLPEGGQGAQNGQGAPGRPGLPQRPTGPTGGPVTGDGPPVPPATGPAVPTGPAAPPHAGLGPGGGLSDDTAILTPQKPAPEPPPGSFYGPAAGNAPGDTVAGGIPVVPPGDRPAPFAPGGPADGPLPHTPPKLPEPVRQSAPAAAPPKKKKGRSKSALLAGAVIFLAGVAYGAGLLMNHSDVPKGTTVLGVDIGGGTRDDAVKKLDDALGDRIGNPLKLSVGGDTVSLKPDQAGLQFDADATVGAAARSDYNPVSVIGSLFGEQRVVEPVMPVDEEKLRSALETAAGGAGTATEGTIRFESGKAVPVYGRAGQSIAVDRAGEAVAEAYRTQVETGTSTPVRVPTTAKEPTVAKAEVDRMMKEFAQPAMSGIVTVQTDPAHRIAFSPENSLWKFLRVQAVDGKLVDVYDKAALKELYGSTFDGVLVTRATGQKTPVTVEDVIGALRPALKSTTNRVATIDTDPS